MGYAPPLMVTKPCANCGTPHPFRVVDVKRGWGRFCSKSCKAQHQVAKGGRKAHLQVQEKKKKVVDSFAEYDAIVEAESTVYRLLMRK